MQIVIVFRVYSPFKCEAIVNVCACHHFSDSNTLDTKSHICVWLATTSVRSCESWLARLLAHSPSLQIPFVFHSKTLFLSCWCECIWRHSLHIVGIHNTCMCVCAVTVYVCTLFVCVRLPISSHSFDLLMFSQHRATQEMRWKNFYFFFVLF